MGIKSKEESLVSRKRITAGDRNQAVAYENTVPTRQHDAHLLFRLRLFIPVAGFRTDQVTIGSGWTLA